MSMIRRVMIGVYPNKVIMKSRKSWFKTKSAEPQADMPALEGEIDQLAQRGQLYGLMPE